MYYCTLFNLNNMKKIFLIILLISGVGFANAQKATKIGHIDTQDLLESMPESKAVQEKLNNYVKELETQIKAMGVEYETKLKDYQNKLTAGTMTDLIKKTKEQEIMDLEKRIQEFQQTAQADIQAKENELLEPILDKAREAISKVAKANGFAYILDLSSGAAVFHEGGEDILPMVKKELGITTAAGK